MGLDGNQILNGFAVILSFWLGYRFGSANSPKAVRAAEKKLAMKNAAAAVATTTTTNTVANIASGSVPATNSTGAGTGSILGTGLGLVAGTVSNNATARAIAKIPVSISLKQLQMITPTLLPFSLLICKYSNIRKMRRLTLQNFPLELQL